MYSEWYIMFTLHALDGAVCTSQKWLFDVEEDKLAVYILQGFFF